MNFCLKVFQQCNKKKLILGLLLLWLVIIIIFIGKEWKEGEIEINNVHNHIADMVKENLGSWMPGNGTFLDVGASFFSKRTPRIVCLVLTAPKFHSSRARAVIETWGKRCDHIFFLSNQDNKEYPYLPLLLSEGTDTYKTSWDRLTMGFRHVYDNLMDEADWILKADDDTFVIMENLKAFLEDKDVNEPVAYGLQHDNMKSKGVPVFNDGGAGYAISKAAFRILVEQGLPNTTVCPQPQRNEDVLIGNCWAKLGVRFGITHDKTGQKFLHDPPGLAFSLKNKQYKKYFTGSGFLCCSELLITFHHLKPAEIYVLDMLIYRVKVAGIDEILNLEELVSEEQDLGKLARKASHIIRRKRRLL